LDNCCHPLDNFTCFTKFKSWAMSPAIWRLLIGGDAQDSWAVLTSQPPSLQTFALYGQSFGGIEPHFKDYKSAAFDVLRSRIRHAHALSCLLMLLAMAQLFAIHLGFLLVHLEQRSRIDWHAQRGLSFLQLGLRELQRLCYLALPLPPLKPLAFSNPPPMTRQLGR
jgi:hypothetical protein